MAKLFNPGGFTTAIRIDRIDAVDKIKNAKGENEVRVFISGMDSGYTLNCGEYENIAKELYNNIVKAIEEL